MIERKIDKSKYYSSGEFAKKAHITKKTIRYYDEHNILKPTYVNHNGNRYYTDEDFARLQQILFLKYLGFSLDDIRQMTMRSVDEHFLAESLKMQLGLIEEKMEQMELVKLSINNALKAVDNEEKVSWNDMLEVVNSNTLEQKLKRQYINSSNISARIMLHKEYSHNEQGWFEWIFDQCDFSENEKILELGCGNGALWKRNVARNPLVSINLTDISAGMIKDVRKNLADIPCISYQVMDAHYINEPDETFDVVIANHLLFYLDNLDSALREIKRVLKSGGRLVCSTYSHEHMKEINELVRDFDNRIVLSADNLYEIFGKENGAGILRRYFNRIEWRQYEDYLMVDNADALVSYILSCHGNQNMYIVDRYKDFRNFVKRKTDKGFRITKDAGIFMAYK